MEFYMLIAYKKEKAWRTCQIMACASLYILILIPNWKIMFSFLHIYYFGKCFEIFALEHLRISNVGGKKMMGSAWFS
ncbi:unnamed protein product [Citrullus colocynthis]|uniref:Uncharacterized protein n=1 Tax=Citrullus colocynthis TaxID=252529 RepID=A0ABP0YAE5_9ROSI